MREITAPAPVRETIDPSIPRMALCTEELSVREIHYQEERRSFTTYATGKLTIQDVKNGVCTVEEMVSQLTVEEMATLCVGTLRNTGSIVGNASHMIPGAAGDTSAVCLESRGIQNMILADGPAGLRLQPIFKTTKDGRLLPGGHMIGELYTPLIPNIPMKTPIPIISTARLFQSAGPLHRVGSFRF